MDTVINKLAEIESGAAKILDEANSKKIELAKQMEEKSKAFDQETDARTAKQLETIKEEYRNAMEQDLAKLRSDTEHVLASMDERFQKEHSALADKIIQQILK